MLGILQNYPEDFKGETSDTNYLSMINADGDPLRTVAVDGIPLRLSLHPYGPDGSPHLFLTAREHTITVYDSNLTLVARAENAVLQNYHLTLKIAGYDDSVYAFSDGLYTRQFSKIMQFPFLAGTVQVVGVDSSGYVTDLILCRSNQYVAGRIVHKDYFQLASVFYHRNQTYIIAVLSALLVGLTVVSWSRKRARQSLALIARQKKDLETAHSELKDAQARLVAAERYKQVRDIAGGFSHEIRNALFPALAGLVSLRKSARDDTSIEAAERIKKAVTRGIDITKLISRFTLLDASPAGVPVALGNTIRKILRNNEQRIAEQSVLVEYEGTLDVEVISDPPLLEMALNNIIVNALDALEQQTEAMINIKGDLYPDNVLMRIEDNGPGISPEDRARAFDAFFSTKPNRGTGVGLTVARKVVEMYGGQVSMEGKPGEGTALILTLPIN